MSYIVKNCPAILKMTKICDAYETTRDNPEFCKDIENCVIKQVIERCKENLGFLETYIDVRSYECTMLQDILDLFDIEEARE